MHRKRVIPGQADHVFREIYAEFVGKNMSVRRDFARLAELDQLKTAKGHFHRSAKRWLAEKTDGAA